MKSYLKFIPVVALSYTAAFAQQDASISSSSNQTNLQQSNPGRSIISEPAGSDVPQGRAFSATNPPPGRAFSTTNPPPGRPFQGGGTPPGRPFTEGESGGIPDAADEPAGAEKPDDASSATNDDASSSSTNLIQEPSGAQQPGAQQSGIQSSTNIEGAGAQRGSSQQLATAIGSIKTGVNVEQNVQLRQAIKTTIKGGNVPDEFVDRLSRDISAAFTKVQVNQTVNVQLADALNTVLTATPTSHSEVEQAITTVQSTLIQNGVAKPQARAVACDLHLIATELVPDLKLNIPTTP
jgi:hypothetical protein